MAAGSPLPGAASTSSAASAPYGCSGSGTQASGAVGVHQAESGRVSILDRYELGKARAGRRGGVSRREPPGVFASRLRISA